MEKAEFEQLMAATRPQLVQQARAIVGEAVAEDIVQDVLLRLYAMLADLRPPLIPLARVMVRNLAIDHQRRQQPQRPLSAMDAETPMEEPQDDGLERVMTLIDELPPLYSTALRLRHIDCMEYKDIALLMGSTVDAVRKNVSRARIMLLKLYNKGKDE